MTGLSNIHVLNDAPWSTDQIRTGHMDRLAEALEPWASWSEDQRRAYAERVVIWTVRHLIADLPGLPDAVRERCRSATTLAEAATAAWAVEATTAAAVAWAAAAARAADAAADPDATLIRAVNGWISCVDGAS